MATVKITYRAISWIAPNEDDSNNVWAVEDSSADPGEILLGSGGTATTPLAIPAPEPLPNFPGYKFVFWNATDGTTALPNFPHTTDKTLTIPATPPGNVDAIAWYVLEGVGDGTGIPGLRARTFDIDIGNFRKETPIQSVNPNPNNTVWPGPNNHRATTSTVAVTVSPEGKLKFPAPAQQQPPGQPAKPFKSWDKVAGTPQIDSPPATTIKCAKGGSALAIAFFGADPPPDKVTVPKLGELVDDEPLLDLYIKIFGTEVAGPLNPDAPHTPRVQRAQILESKGFASFRANVETTLRAMPEKQRTIAIQNIKTIPRQAH